MKTTREVKIFLSLLGFYADQLHAIEDKLPIFLESKDLFLTQVSSIITKNQFQRIKSTDIDSTFEYLEKEIDRLDMTVIVDEDDDFPVELSYIDNPPVVVYVRGDLHRVLRKERCGIVGARSHTAYGKAVAKDISQALVSREVAIVSGMALGIDAIAQWACLDAGGTSIGVLGTGIDVIYPARNKDLYARLLDEGAILTEYPPGAKARPFHFPLRNRLISALSKAVVVVEAKEKSGSLITARYAAEQGKEIFAVPGNINSPYSGGTNVLIRDGALIYTKEEDFDFLFPNKNHKTENIDLGEDEIYYLKCIGMGLNTANLICEKSGHKISTVNMILTLLEMKGLINAQGTDQFALNSSISIDEL